MSVDEILAALKDVLSLTEDRGQAAFYSTSLGRSLQLAAHVWQAPVLNINDHATGGRRTKDILGGPKGWGPKKKVANAEIYVIFEVFAFCGGRTKTDFKDREHMSTYNSVLGVEGLYLV